MDTDSHDTNLINKMSDQKNLEHYLQKGEALRSKFPILEYEITEKNTISWATIALDKKYGANPNRMMTIDTIIQIFDRTLNRFIPDENFKSETQFQKEFIINSKINEINQILEVLKIDNAEIRKAETAMKPNLLDEKEKLELLLKRIGQKVKVPLIIQSALAVALENLRNDSIESNTNPLKGKTQDEVSVIGYLLFKNIKTRKRFINANGIRTCLNSSYKCTDEDTQIVREHIFANNDLILELLKSKKVKNMVKTMQKNRITSTKPQAKRRAYKKKL